MSARVSSHLEALSTFESSNNHLESVQKKISSFRTQTRTKLKTQQLEWVNEGRRLRLAEEHLKKQLYNSISKLIDELKTENQSSAWNDVLEIQGTPNTLDTMSTNTPLSLAIEVTEVMKTYPNGKDKQFINGITQLIVDTKQKISTGDSQLQGRYSSLDSEVITLRQTIMQQVVKQANNVDYKTLLSNHLTTAISDARILQNKITQLMAHKHDDFGVDLLEYELMNELAELPDLKSKITKRLRLLEIEKQAAKSVQHLNRKLKKRYKSITDHFQTRLKSNELNIRIDATRSVKENVSKISEQKRLEEERKVASARDNQELRQMMRSINSKKSIWNHKSTCEHTIEPAIFETELESEILRLSKQRVNEKRTKKREAQRLDKIRFQEEASVASAKVEQHRLERLSILASTVPYYRNIIELVPDIHKTTEARKNDVYTRPDASLADFQYGAMKSFSNDKVFSDPKFRLASALHKAGVAQSIYARNVVRNAIPRSEERTTGIMPY